MLLSAFDLQQNLVRKFDDSFEKARPLRTALLDRSPHLGENESMFALGALPETLCKHLHLVEIGYQANSTLSNKATTCNCQCAQFCLNKIKTFAYAHGTHKYKELFRLINAANASKVNQARLIN